MGSYYYLIPSLPDLKADGEMPLSYEEFLSCCQSNVSEENYELLKNLTLSSAKGPLVEEWADAYGMLTKELNYQRSLNLGKTYPQNYSKDGMSAQVAAAALSAPNPLEAEKLLLDYEFGLLDTLVGSHVFDDYVLFGYAIKLKLLERQNCFEHEKGKEELQYLFDGVQKSVYGL